MAICGFLAWTTSTTTSTRRRRSGSVAKVYFSPVIDEASLIKLYNLVNEGIYGKVAIKMHTEEPNGPNILPRELVAALQKTIPDSAIVETNTLYEGGLRRGISPVGAPLSRLAAPAKFD